MGCGKDEDEDEEDDLTPIDAVHVVGDGIKMEIALVLVRKVVLRNGPDIYICGLCSVGDA